MKRRRFRKREDVQWLLPRSGKFGRGTSPLLRCNRKKKLRITVCSNPPNKLFRKTSRRLQIDQGIHPREEQMVLSAYGRYPNVPRVCRTTTASCSMYAFISYEDRLGNPLVPVPLPTQMNLGRYMAIVSNKNIADCNTAHDFSCSPIMIGIVVIIVSVPMTRSATGTVMVHVASCCLFPPPAVTVSMAMSPIAGGRRGC